MAEKQLIRDYTSGNLGRQMLGFSVPFMISNALQVLYGIVDMIVVGQVLGSPGLSAVGTASQVVTFMTMICLGFCTGGQVYISQLIGAGRLDELNATIGTLFTVMAILGVGISAVGMVFARPIIALLNTPAASFEMAEQYLLICSGGVLITYGYNVVSAVLRGMGESIQPCIYIAVAAVTNLVLDIVFVICWGWGVPGAAAATVIGQAVSFLTSIVYLVRHKVAFGFDFRPASFRPVGRIVRRLTSLGIPFALRSAAVNISMLFVTGLVNGVSVEASAVFSVGLKVDDVVRKISMAVNYSVSTLVGQNFAAGEFARAKHSVYWGWLYSFLIYLIFCAVYLTNIEGLFRLFTPDPGVLELAPVFVRAILWSFPGMILMRGTNGFIQGIGNSRLTLLLALLDGFVLRIGLSYLLGVTFGLGLYGFFLGYGLAVYGTSIPSVFYVLSGVWRKRAPLGADSVPAGAD